LSQRAPAGGSSFLSPTPIPGPLTGPAVSTPPVVECVDLVIRVLPRALGLRALPLGIKGRGAVRRCDILTRRTNAQMVGVYAVLSAAHDMVHHMARWNLTVSQHPGQPVRVERSPTDQDRSVALCGFPGAPRQTTSLIRRAYT